MMDCTICGAAHHAVHPKMGPLCWFHHAIYDKLPASFKRGS